MNEQLKILRKINRRTRFTQFLAWLALFFTAVGIAAGYKNWLRIHDKAKLALRQIEEIKQEMPNFALQEKLAILEKELNDIFKENKAHLDKAMNELRTIQDSTQHIADSVYVQAQTLTHQQAPVKIQTPTLKDWTLGEVHFLLQTAVQQFELKKDKDSAIVSFKLADNLLLERGELDLLPVRKQISEDIAIVNQHEVIDVSDLSQKIDDLLEQLKPVFKQEQASSESIELLPSSKESDAIDGSNTEIKDSLVNRVKKTINDAVIVRKLDKPLQEDLDLDSKERLYQLFSLRFETLKIMILQGDNDNFHKQIKRIKSLLVNYYPAKKNTAYLEQLKILDQADLSPDLPDVNDSLELLEKIMTEKKIMDKDIKKAGKQILKNGAELK
ncbi:MAG: uroporphyrin-3 C-methyltransferase [Cocleimonas sp.]|jgi:uroporphyrin-3 C-methyltransferase